ncbi:unnamed protein product [Echinostoma caproni]|uniref:GYF_2 domain-containing protein n=1 Tax=Echinostoma caproni TaxID=27848 RepID=A0A183B010_9TREM|nr:unnamed protein product [Echinostoma caproni]
MKITASTDRAPEALFGSKSGGTGKGTTDSWSVSKEAWESEEDWVRKDPLEPNAFRLVPGDSDGEEP